MRLYSPAGFMVVSKESPPGGVTLRGYHIPAGTHMAVSKQCPTCYNICTVHTVTVPPSPPPPLSISSQTHPACVHRMPQYFEEPDSFNPSRFDPENKKYLTFFGYCTQTHCFPMFASLRPSPFIYFPFGVGHRMCIGMHFAMVSETGRRGGGGGDMQKVVRMCCHCRWR